MDPDELQHVLDIVTPSEQILDDLAASIKKSLAALFPRFAEPIHEIVDSSTAIKAIGWACRFQPLHEGVEALRTIYGGREALRERNQAVKEYAGLARHYFLTPLALDGKARKKQLAAPRDKKNRALMNCAAALMRKKAAGSAAELWRRLPDRDKPEIIDGWTIYRDCPESGIEKIYCISPAGTSKSVNRRAFQKYFNEIQKKLAR